eukprot:c52591_g1_i1.p1 GENE.c52591_g1_i1~~c52591_g1_i1.p1  ORF type:complete len:204 (+),score=14.99 c52591_g1_i1:36-614(+)
MEGFGVWLVLLCCLPLALVDASSALDPKLDPNPKMARAIANGESQRPNAPMTTLPIYLPRKRCEICVTVLMRKMAQVPHLCSGLESYYETCNDVISSTLHWYPNLIYWSWSGGCDMVFEDGITKRIRPCPAHAICGWLTSPNYHVAFCPWDPAFKAPGLEDSLYPASIRPTDNLPKLGGPQGLAYLPGLGAS